MSTNARSLPSNVPNPSAAPRFKMTSDDRPVIIGLYGIAGSGKTYLLNQLEAALGRDSFAYFEGSAVIDSVVPGGLPAFKGLGDEGQLHWRQRAIEKIRKDCVDNKKVGIVTGHFMFWSETKGFGSPVYTQNDLEAYTHIVYLDTPIEVVAERCQNDTERNRPFIPRNYLDVWQQAEKAQLRPLCQNHGIFFFLLPPDEGSLERLPATLSDFGRHNTKYNLIQAEHRLDAALANYEKLDTILFIDGDKTLAPEDTSVLFWDKVQTSHWSKGEEYPLKTIFSSPSQYSYAAFRQATLLYEEFSDEEFDALCGEVALKVAIHPEFVSLLHVAANHKHVGAVVVTCGLGHLWNKVLMREGLSETVKVIGGGRIADGFVVTPVVKGSLVTRAQNIHKSRVLAFGDSPLDMEMLTKADEAIVMVGKEDVRSKSMDHALRNAIETRGLRAHQVVLPSSSSPRLTPDKLPLVQLTDHKFINPIFSRSGLEPRLEVIHATDSAAAKLLMTPMRDATVVGPNLRKFHRRTGLYLATEHLPKIIGLEEYGIPHVQSHLTLGFRLLHEQRTLIVALMRGGQPMAEGVNKAFPLAMFLHARVPEDIGKDHLEGQLTVLLVDSVVNNGKTVLDFAQHIRTLHASIRIVVVTSVVQKQFVSRDLTQALAPYDKLYIIALRLSDNKFTGSGTTDTGNRLFNTTHLP
ncbi:hypothetical protein FQN51_002147 [Onygenales sp. PD_10]|nr:hypothetical protein FQN51_002147 [Onygenales sp. PD_10]